MTDKRNHMESGNEDHEVFIEDSLSSLIRGKKPAKKTGKPLVEALRPRAPAAAALAAEPDVHILKPGIRCDTDTRGHATPRGRSPLEIVVDASEGFIPLWAKNTTLRWRFRESTMSYFANPVAAKNAIRTLLGEAVLKWGDAVPVKFAERKDAWDFEIVMKKQDDCDANGCVLASAFFPDAGRHELVLYPQLFLYDHTEQLDTLIHEIGHIFGLRHFFAKVSEDEWPSEIFGKHTSFTIMNYGSKSKLTAADKSDLKKLYKAVWSGKLKKINGTPIRQVKPYHAAGASSDDLLAAAMVEVGPFDQ